MLLAIDAGNTNVKFALFAGGELIRHWRLSTDHGRTADEYRALLVPLFREAEVDATEVTDVAITSVVPPVVDSLRTFARDMFGCDAAVAGHGALQWGIALDVAEPQNVGADRACNAIAAHAAIPGHKIVISFGTATTMDWIDDQGAYRGGMIAPGIALSLDALVRGAAKLPRVAIAPPAGATVIGKTTESQMQIGVFWGAVSMTEAMVVRFKAEIGGPAHVVATGGLAPMLAPSCPVIDTVDTNLTLRGLALLYERSVRN